VDRVRDVQRGIAADEARHAELAWDVLAWTLREGGDDVRHAVWASRDAVPGGGSGGPDGIALDAYGVLSERAHERVEDETRAQALGRLGRVPA
jgi:hypothetical protein